jgi:phage gpG-like protein
MSATIEVRSEAVTAAFNALGARVGDMSPVLIALGDDIIERTKQRFASATGPDGTPWLPNTQATLIAYLRKKGGFSGKTGKITAKGQTLAAGKRPLQGESGDLERQFSSLVVSGNTLLVGSTMIYAAMQQFGGTKGQFPNLWGDIPARPFLPITPDGGLYAEEENLIVESVRQYLVG